MGPDDGATGRTGVTSQAAVAACAGMALFYVAILYAPMLVLRLPPPTSVESFLIRRFVCAIVSSIASVVLSSALLGVRSFEHISTIFNIHGIRGDHMWQAVAYPVLLTSLPYMGTFASKLLRTVPTRMSGKSGYDAFSCRSLKERTASLTSNVMAWRNYVMAPITEELVFRASMIPLLLCGGFRIHNVIFFTPIFFSLAHLNHLFELYYWQNLSFVRAFMVVGFQLCYTVIFGSYAAFLFIRTGNLASPLVAHVFCNVMGLPALSSSHSKVILSAASIAGVIAFFFLLFPATDPKIYNNTTDNCMCWHGYCHWH